MILETIFLWFGGILLNLILLALIVYITGSIIIYCWNNYYNLKYNTKVIIALIRNHIKEVEELKEKFTGIKKEEEKEGYKF